MNLADRIPKYVKKAYIDPARKAKLSKVTFSSAKIHNDLTLEAHKRPCGPGLKAATSSMNVRNRCEPHHANWTAR